MNTIQNSWEQKRNLQVISAVPFTEEQKSRLNEILQNKLPNISYEYEYVVDKDVLGGVCLKTKSFVLDASYRKHLSELYSTVFRRKNL